MNTDVDSLALAKLVSGTDTILAARGFRQDKMYWRNKESAESVSVCHFYCSGFLVGVELCAYVHGLSHPEIPKPTVKHMHASASLSQLTRVCSMNHNRIVLEQGKAQLNEAIVQEALTAIRTVAIPILLDLMSLNGLRRIFNTYGNLRWAISPELRIFLYGSSTVDLPGSLPWQPWELDG